MSAEISFLPWLIIYPEVIKEFALQSARQGSGRKRQPLVTVGITLAVRNFTGGSASAYGGAVRRRGARGGVYNTGGPPATLVGVHL